MAVLTRAARLAVALGLIAGGHARADGVSLEYEVKANYLYKFAPFVDWPARTFDSATSPLNVCVVGQDPFGSALDDAARGQSVDGHPITVRRAPTASPGMACHILFLGKSATQTRADMIRAVAGQPVLTVADGAGDGAMIQFVLGGGHVRFDIDASAAEASGVPISSKLLGLALSVHKAPR